MDPTMQTNPESAAVAAVAWDYSPEHRIAVTDGKGGARMTLNGHGAPAGISLYHGDYVSELQSALDALRGEAAELQQNLDRLSGMKFSDRMHAALVSRADAAERRVAELRELCGDMLKVFEAARPLVLNLERLRDAVTLTGADPK